MREIFLHLEELKKETHYYSCPLYQDPNIQDVAAFMGDSFAHAQQAMTTNANIILNPEKQVILLDINAGCSLETMAPEISISDDIRIRTLKPLKRMLALS